MALILICTCVTVRRGCSGSRTEPHLFIVGQINGSCGFWEFWNDETARHDARRSCSVSVCCEKKQTGFLFSELHCSLGRGCDVCWSCVYASNEFPNLDIMKSHLSVSAGVTILMMTLGRDQLHIRGISFVPVLMLAGADRKLWPWHERQAHPATCYTPRTKERAKVVTNGGLFVKAHTPTRVVQAALRAETSWGKDLKALLKQSPSPLQRCSPCCKKHLWHPLTSLTRSKHLLRVELTLLSHSRETSCCRCTLSPHGGTNTKFHDGVSTRDYCASRYRDVIHFASGRPGIRGDCAVHMCCNQMLPPPVPISVWIKTEGILHLTTSLHVHGTGVPVESCAEAFAPDKHKVGGFTSCKHRLSRSSIFTRFHRICYK